MSAAQEARSSPHALSGAFALVGGRVVLGDEVRRDVAVVVAEGRILEVVQESAVDHAVRRVDVGERLVTPGLIDVHVHGALGHSFADPSEWAHREMSAFFLERGVTTVLASLGTAHLEELCASIEFISRRMSDLGPESPILGIHLEGPYLAESQRGAHDATRLQTPSAEATARLLEHREVLRMVTLAPELPGALELVDALVAAGIGVAVGHSAAGSEELRRAVEAGLGHITHLWSGQSTLTREGPWRVPGLIDLSLASDGLTAEVIADGKHLPPPLLEIARRCLSGRLCVVSDGSIGTGLDEGTRYSKDGVDCVVRDGVAMVEGEASFAGSTTSLDAMLALLTGSLDWPVAEVVAMGTSVPASVLGLEATKGQLVAGFDADICVFDPGFRARGVLRGGRWVVGAEEFGE
jgi:N-acetylglucosamine-6-phosphate deacetylase